MSTATTTDDLRILALDELVTPAHLIKEFPVSSAVAGTVSKARQTIHRILHGMDDRLLVVIGPCSIHDPAAARDYATRLMEQRKRFGDRLEIVMRVYFEKPRTTVGWKGLINDPRLDGSFAAAGHQCDGHAGRHRVPGHDHAAVHRGPDFVGGHRGAHDGVAGAP